MKLRRDGLSATEGCSIRRGTPGKVFKMDNLTLAFLDMSPMHLLMIGVILLLIFGKRLPEVGKNLGKSIVEFKKGMASATDTDATENENHAAVPPATAVKPKLTASKAKPSKQIVGNTDEP